MREYMQQFLRLCMDGAWECQCTDVVHNTESLSAYYHAIRLWDVRHPHALHVCMLSLPTVTLRA